MNKRKENQKKFVLASFRTKNIFFCFVHIKSNNLGFVRLSFFGISVIDHEELSLLHMPKPPSTRSPPPPKKKIVANDVQYRHPAFF